MTSKTLSAAVALVAIWGLGLVAAWPQSQAKTKAAPVATPQPAPAPAAAPPPYEPQLLRLAELMGSLAYLRDLCRDGDGVSFHDRFAKLMDVEAPTSERKEALAGAFNRGFADYQLTHRTCTPSAKDTIVRYLEETQQIARFVATRYGG